MLLWQLVYLLYSVLPNYLDEIFFAHPDQTAPKKQSDQGLQRKS